MNSLLRLVQSSGPGSSRRSVRSKRRQFSIEPLESRVLPTIVWANRGTASSDTDGFNSSYGTNAAVARAIVNHAIADWNATIVSPVTLSLTIRAGAFASAGETTIQFATSQGVPTAATISLDNNATGSGWYFDSNIQTDIEFTGIVSPFTAYGAVGGIDFYTVAAHEIGHSLGYYLSSQLAIWPHLSSTGPGQLQFSRTLGTRTYDFDLITTGGLHSADGSDLMGQGSILPQRRLISTNTAILLGVAYGYGVVSPSQRDTIYVDSYLTSTGVPAATVRVNPAGSMITRIYLEAGYNRIDIGPDIFGPFLPGTEPNDGERVPVNAQITVLGTGFDDSLAIHRNTSVGGQRITFQGGNGRDAVNYWMGTQTQVTVSGNTLVGNAPAGQPFPAFLLNAEELTVMGSEGNDQIRVDRNSFQEISVAGLRGDDIIDGRNDGSVVSVGLYALGGDGNDQLWGSPNSDILMGEDGADVIDGGNGRDILIGGVGADRITANTSPLDEDIVIGGDYFYIYAGIGGGLPADMDIVAILAEWRSSRSRAQRIANISGTGTGSRLNGAAFLNSSTVTNDGIADTIFSTGSIDWLILS